MRVEAVSLYNVSLSLKVPFAASSHAAHRLEHVLVRLRTDAGDGWGECATTIDPYYLGETLRSTWAVLEDFLAPAVVGRSFDSVESFRDAYAGVKGNTFAKCGIEMAAWDALGKAEGRSVASMLGGTRARVESGVSLGIDRDLGRFFAQIDGHLAQGYRRLKVKIDPSWDVALLGPLRERYPDVSLVVDANSAYTLRDLDHLKQLDAFGLTMIEQPLAWDDFLDHAELQRHLTTPVCLDESVRSLGDARLALELGAAKILNVKAARLGGLLEAKRVHDLCAARGVPVWCGGMHDYGVGRAANVALASLPGFTMPGDVSGSDKYFHEDVVDPPFVAVAGSLAVREAPGLGIDVLADRVLKSTLAAVEVRP